RCAHRPEGPAMRLRHCLPAAVALVLALAGPARLNAACCYFSAQNTDILQPAQKVFITWDPAKQQETFTVQPKFEGNALDFGMVIPTPSQPKLHEMPRDFFKHLAVYSILKKREFPHSKLLPAEAVRLRSVTASNMSSLGSVVTLARKNDEPTVRVVESGIVGSLDYKIIEASR